jgi:hypothetical protein
MMVDSLLWRRMLATVDIECPVQSRRASFLLLTHFFVYVFPYSNVFLKSNHLDFVMVPDDPLSKSVIGVPVMV